MSIALSPAVSALAGATVHPLEAALIDKLRGRDGTVLDFATGHALQRAGGAGWLRPIGDAADLTFGRASTATYLDASGNRQAAPNNVLRFDHDPATLDPLGAFIEAARTNALANPAFLSGLTGWVAQTYGSTTWAVVDEPSAYGGKALHIVAGATPSTLDARYQTGVLTGGVVSVRLRRVSASGTLNVREGGGVGTTLNPASSDWITYRSIAIGVGTGNFVFGAPSADSEWLVDWIQVENGQTWSSSFIPGGTRAADGLYQSLAGVDPSAGLTIAAQVRSPPGQNSGDNNAVFYAVPPTGFTNRFGIICYGNGSSYNISVAKDGSVITSDNILIGDTQGIDVALVLSWSPTHLYRACAQGGDVLKVASTTAPSASISRIGWGNRAGGALFGGTIKRAAVWPHGDFSDEELRGLLA